MIVGASSEQVQTNEAAVVVGAVLVMAWCGGWRPSSPVTVEVRRIGDRQGSLL